MNQAISLVADIGGTFARFATVGAQSKSLQGIEVFRCADFLHLEDAIAHYLRHNLAHKSHTLQALCVAVPGAVHQDPVTLANLPWQVSKQQLGERFKCPVFVINDFSAQAMALPTLDSSDIRWFRAPSSPLHSQQAKLIVGPGTGLGVAAILPGGDIVESEAGHCSFAPTSYLQTEILLAMRDVFPHVSVERLVSGPGLSNIHKTLSAMAGIDQCLAPDLITQGARDGDPLCQNTIREFTRMFGSACGDFALALGALGGVYLTGGVFARMQDLFDENLFFQEFAAKGRFSDYCRSIPIAAIRCEHPGLFGAASYLTLHTSTQAAAVRKHKQEVASEHP